MNQLVIEKSFVLAEWHRIMRRVVFRGAPRISSLLCRWLLPKISVTRAAHGYLMIIRSDDYVEACALCDCLNRHLVNFVHNFLQPGDIFIDGGSNIGQFTLLAALKVGSSGMVISYEPNSTVASRLKQSCIVNGFSWVEVQQTALGSRDGVESFYIAENSQLSSLYELPSRLGSYKTVDCKIVKLDDELKRLSVPTERIALVKLDLEGGELEALHSMESLLSTNDPPAFLVELNTVCRPEGKQIVQQIVELFHSRGFETFIIQDFKASLGYESPYIHPLKQLPAVFADCLFVKPESRFCRRLSMATRASNG